MKSLAGFHEKRNSILNEEIGVGDEEKKKHIEMKRSSF